MDNLPKDPVILLSYINTMLRDKFASLDELCGAYDIAPGELMSRLKPLDVEYVEAINQIR